MRKFDRIAEDQRFQMQMIIRIFNHHLSIIHLCRSNLPTRLKTVRTQLKICKFNGEDVINEIIHGSRGANISLFSLDQLKTYVVFQIK